MPFFDDKCKKNTWFTRNYFFLGTLLFVALNILLFVCLGNSWEDTYGGVHDLWSKPFEYGNLIRSLFNCMSHSDWEHVLFNMLFFAVAALYMERKMGTLCFVLFICGALVFDASITTATDLALNWHGWSGIVYITQFYVFVDYIFSFQKSKRNKFNIIFGAIVCLISYISMAASIKDGTLIIYGYPHGLVYNAGHYSAAVAGIILSLIVQISQLKVAKQMQYVEIEKTPNTKAIKVFYAVVAVFMALLSTTTTLAALAANNRSNIECSIIFNSEIDSFDQEYTVDFQSKKNWSYQNFIYEWLSEIPFEQKEKYGFEFYLDKDYTQGFIKKYNVKNSSYETPWGRGEFVPLATNPHQTIYVKTYEICTVEFKNATSFINGDFAGSFEKENFYFAYNYYYEYTAVAKNSTLKFKLENTIYPAEDILLSINGTPLVADEEGYYTIENIAEDITVVFGLK